MQINVKRKKITCTDVITVVYILSQCSVPSCAEDPGAKTLKCIGLQKECKTEKKHWTRSTKISAVA